MPCVVESFPIVYVPDVAAALAFYCDVLGAEERYRFPEGDAAIFVQLRTGEGGLGIAHESSPRQLIGRGLEDGVRFELFAYVDDLDGMVEALRSAGATILREPEVMPWGERIAYTCDPLGNPVVVAAAPRP